jgi:hypothetical protein
MQAHNVEMLQDLKETWQGHFRRIFTNTTPAVQQPRAQILDFDKALKSAYGVSLPDCHSQRDITQI